MPGRFPATMLIVALLLTCTAFAQNTPPVDDWGDGEDEDFNFGEDDDFKVDGAGHSNWSLGGFLRSDWALRTERLDDKPWAKGRQNLDLSLGYKKGFFRLLLAGHAEYDLAYLASRDDYDEFTLDTYEWDLQSRELIAAFSLGEVEITLGRQIVVWGEGDAFSLLDVVNPRDLREPGAADLDDLRLPILATRIGWFVGSHRFEAMVIHEAAFGLRPPPMGEFSPLPALVEDSPEIIPGASVKDFIDSKELYYEDKQDRFALDGQQFLLRWVYKGAGIDLGLYGAYVQDQQGALGLPGAAILAQETRVPLLLDHAKYWVTGTSGAFSWESFLFKWEVAAEIDRSINVGKFLDFPPDLRSVPTELVGSVLGITWTGVSDLMIAIEASKRWYLDRPDDLLLEHDHLYTMLRIRYTMLRERLTLSAVGVLMGAEMQLGWLGRFEGIYELMDGLKASIGYITYQPGDDFGPLKGLDNHDRLFARLRWDFQLF